MTCNGKVNDAATEKIRYYDVLKCIDVGTLCMRVITNTKQRIAQVIHGNKLFFTEKVATLGIMNRYNS